MCSLIVHLCILFAHLDLPRWTGRASWTTAPHRPPRGCLGDCLLRGADESTCFINSIPLSIYMYKGDNISVYIYIYTRSYMHLSDMRISHYVSLSLSLSLSIYLSLYLSISLSFSFSLSLSLYISLSLAISLTLLKLCACVCHRVPMRTPPRRCAPTP